MVLPVLLAALLDPLLDPPAEAAVEPVEPFDADEEPEPLLARNVLLPTPKPMAAASLPLPPIKIALLVSLLVMTNLPWALSEAVTLALVGRFRLMAFRRSATVSVPVDV